MLDAAFAAQRRIETMYRITFWDPNTLHRTRIYSGVDENVFKWLNHAMECIKYSRIEYQEITIPYGQSKLWDEALAHSNNTKSSIQSMT